MCHDCVTDEYPQRDNICLENGAYYLNFEICAMCKGKDVLTTAGRCCEEIDGVEIITYQHVCKTCDHVVGEHEYRFTVEDGYQMYEMECLLCGTADDMRSVLPNDPRNSALLF